MSIRMVSLDFDGTIMVYDEEPGFFHPEIIACLNAMEGKGVAWCANSGRDFESQMEVLTLSARRGLRHWPAAILGSETLIFLREGEGYRPHEAWNSRAAALLREIHGEVHRAIDGDLDRWHQEYQPGAVVIHEEATAFFIAEAEGLADRFFAEIEERVRPIPGAVVTQNGGWIAVIPEELGKGHILNEFLTISGIERDAALAIGDHVNDVTMLDGSAARHVGCPANGAPRVLQTVLAAGGTVATQEGPLGTLEILKSFLDL